MVVAYRTLMCAQYPSFKQGGYSVAMGQQIVANFCRLAHHVMGISKRDQSGITFPAISTKCLSLIKTIILRLVWRDSVVPLSVE